MSQAVAAPNTGDPFITGGKSVMETGKSTGFAGSVSPSVVRLPVRRRLRADVPPFDPSNPAHISAWEALYDFGRLEMEKGA